MLFMKAIRQSAGNRRDKSLSFAICAIVVGLFITNIAEGIAGEGTLQRVISLLCKAFILASLVLCVPAILSRMNRMLVITTAAVALVIALNCLLFPDTLGHFTGTAKTFLLTIFPGMVCFMLLEDYELCLGWLRRAAYLVAILNVAVILACRGLHFSSGYDMGYANALILPTNLLIYVFWKRRQGVAAKLGTLALIAVNVFSVLAFGSRGSLVAMGVFFIVYGFKAMSRKLSRTTKTVLVSLLALCVLMYRYIFLGLFYLLEAVAGIRSRALYMLANVFSNDSGRGDIYNAILTKLRESPLAIRGINADYNVVGGYSHNIFLELIFAFGVVIGVVLCAYILYHIVRTLMEKTDALGTMKLLMLFSFFPICLWSSSIWTSLYFWLWMVISWRTKRCPRGMV